MNTRRLPYSLFRLGLVCFWLTVLLFRQTTFAKTYTAPCNSIFYVKANATGANNGSSWADAYTSLQDALAVTCSGAQIWVAAGTYKPTADPSGNTSPADPRTKTFVMKNGVAIYGGFPNSGTPVMANRNVLANPTILSGDIGNLGVDTDNSYRVINNTFTSGSPLDNTAILDGVIVEKGYADGNFPLSLGGGMWNTYASPKIQNCVFRNNYAAAGGGMFNDNSSSMVAGCLFFNNTGTVAGAGISNGGGTALVKILNCTFYGNTGSVTIANGPETSIINSIIWGNSGGISNGLVSYSIVQGGFFGMNNTNVDPRFVNAAGGDFRLQQYSPAIDAGIDTDAPTTDLAGNVRPFNATGISKPDIGAYEYNQSTYDFCATYTNVTGEVFSLSTPVHNRYANGAVWRACGLSKVRITAKGARGGNNGSSGAVMIGDFIIMSGQVLESMAGALGGDGTKGGGGGGSGTRIQGGLPLIIAGGGGGDNYGGIGVVTTGNGGGGNWLIYGGGGGGGLYGNGFGGILGGGAGFNAIGGYAYDGYGAGGGGYGAGGSGSGLEDKDYSGGGGGQTGGDAYDSGRRGGSSYNLGSNQNNTAGANNASGQVIIEYLGTATVSATVTPTELTCTSPTQGSISIDLTGDLNGNTSGGVEYAIVSGNSFTGTPTFAAITADPFNVTSGTGTMTGTYTVRIRLKYNPDIFVDRNYSIGPRPCNCTFYVKENASGANNGSSWADAYTSLQDALAVACSGAQIWVAAGTYKPDQGIGYTPGNRSHSFSMKSGVSIYGGFSGTETQFSQRNWLTNVTTLSGDIGMSGSNGDNSYSVISNDGTNSVVIDGFTVTQANATPPTGNGLGGGIYNSSSSPIIRNCIFSNNTGNYINAGIFNYDGGTPTIINCLFINNVGNVYSSGVTNLEGSVNITNCTFYGNHTAIINQGGELLSVRNCILWGNNNSFNIISAATTSTVANSIIQGGWVGTGNLNTAPLFVNAASGDFRLQPCSPAINAGDPSTTSATVGNVDLGGNSRFYNNERIDMGAYEYQSTPPAAITPTVSSSNPTTCGGVEGSITLSGFLANTIYSVTYKKNNVAISAANFTSNGSGVITLTGLGAGNYTDIVATYGVCVSNAVTATLEDPAKPSLTLGTIPAICAGATTFSIPYNNPTDSPNKYTITGMGITTVSDGDLTNPITVQLGGSASGSLISFTLTVKNSTTTCVSNSIQGSVTVDPVSAGGSIAGSATVCSGTNSTTLTLSGQVGAIQKWQSSLSSDFSGAVDIANTTTELTASNLTQTTYYRAIVKNGVCSEAISSSATVTVDPVSAGGSIAGSATVCSGTNSTTLTLSGQVGTIQKWQSSLSSDFSGAVDITNTTTELTASNLTQTTYYRAVIKSGVCSQANSTSATVTVDPVSVGGSISGSATVCSGVNSTVLTLSGHVGTIQKWQSSLSSDFSGAVDIANTTTELIASNLTQTTYYRAVLKSGVCSQTNSTSATVTVDPVSVGGSIAGSATVCSGTNSTVLTLSGQVGTIQKWQSSLSSDFSGAVDIANTTTELIASNLTQTTYYRAIVKSGVCSQAISMTARIQVQMKPTITLTTLQQTLSEGNAQTFCDTDANPVNGLQFTVSGLCVVGNPVWRVQVGSGAWSEWMTNAPVSQLSNNQSHRYQAACDASCAVTYTSPIELTINYRASTPQNVSLVADGASVNAGETKEVCNIEGNALTFNATCGAGEMLLYSVDGGEYSSTLPTQLVDGQYHNYRVRCRKSDGTVSCVESESGVMRLRIVSSSLAAPVASLNVTSGCGSPVSFSGTANCGALTTVWYNAVTNLALPSLPNQTPTETSSYYARCQAGGGCLSEKSNVVTYTVIPLGVAPAVTVSQEIVCTGTTVRISANCPAGSQTFWNTGVTASSFEVSFSNVTKQSYWAKCLFEGGCQSAESVRKDVYWNAFVVTLINIGESKSAVKVNNRSAWTSQFITRDGGPELEQSTQINPTLYYVENTNKMAPRYWTINVDACALGTNGSLTFDMLATPEMGVLRSFNTHENNAPYFMYANREGWTELYAQNHPAYGFYQDNGAGANVYDAGLPKGLYKLGIRYWDQKGWGSIYPSTRKAQGNVLAYQEYWFRIQSKDGVGVGAAREGANGKEQEAKSKWQGANGQGSDNGQPITENGAFAMVLPNPVTHTLRLKVQDSKGQLVQTTLSDAAGRDVLSRQFVPETNTHQEEFGVSALPTGMYFLKVSTAEKQATLKVVKVE